jgi:hypothetical protein
MAYAHFEKFLYEATAWDPQADHCLGRDELYGLYTSWCLLKNIEPKPDKKFWAAMRRRGIGIGDSRLHMTGPAAVYYILTSYPSLT